MLYTILGKLVWKGAKRFLRHRYGRTYVPKPVLGAVAAATVGTAALVVLQKRKPE